MFIYKNGVYLQECFVVAVFVGEGGGGEETNIPGVGVLIFSSLIYCGPGLFILKCRKSKTCQNMPRNTVFGF